MIRKLSDAFSFILIWVFTISLGGFILKELSPEIVVRHYGLSLAGGFGIHIIAALVYLLWNSERAYIYVNLLLWMGLFLLSLLYGSTSTAFLKYIGAYAPFLALSFSIVIHKHIKNLY